MVLIVFECIYTGTKCFRCPTLPECAHPSALHPVAQVSWYIIPHPTPITLVIQNPVACVVRSTHTPSVVHKSLLIYTPNNVHLSFLPIPMCLRLIYKKSKAQDGGGGGPDTSPSHQRRRGCGEAQCSHTCISTKIQGWRQGGPRCLHPNPLSKAGCPYPTQNRNQASLSIRTNWTYRRVQTKSSSNPTLRNSGIYR